MIEDREGYIIENLHLGLNFYEVKIELSKPISHVEPGQFVMVRLFSSEVFLRRPFSIYEIFSDGIVILYKVVGKGTYILSQMKRGDRIDVLGPLGKGFSLKEGKAILVAGGVGIAGLNLLLRRKREAVLLFGCKTKDELCLLREIKNEVHISTIDGSFGFKGDVIELFSFYTRELKDPFSVYACGPRDMYKALKGILSQRNVFCEALFEERMACGMGLCFGCVIETKDEKEPFKRLCLDGPVFNLWEISL